MRSLCCPQAHSLPQTQNGKQPWCPMEGAMRNASLVGLGIALALQKLLRPWVQHGVDTRARSELRSSSLGKKINMLSKSERKSKTVTIGRWHDISYTKPWRFHHKTNKTIRTNKLSKVVGCKINIKICCPSVILKMNYQKSKLKNKQTMVYNCIKKYRRPRNKLNQGGRRPVYWKLWDTDGRHWRRHKWMEDILCS